MSRNDVILGAAALVLVVFSLVVSLVIPRRDAGFPGRNLKVFTLVSILLVVAMLASGFAALAMERIAYDEFGYAKTFGADIDAELHRTHR